MDAAFFHVHTVECDPVCVLARDVWEVLEAQPGFNEELAQARKDIEEGRGTPFSELRRS